MTPFQLRTLHGRRDFLQNCASGIGVMALADLLTLDGLTAASTKGGPLRPAAPHFAPKAKNFIFMFMEGGPSQYELFDPKPALNQYHGKPLPESQTEGLEFAFIQPSASILASSVPFRRYGRCGMKLSELIPHIGSCADDISLVRSMHTDSFNHHPGQLLLFTGTIQMGRPSLGAWIAYGLGSESRNLPGFVVLTSGPGGTSGGSTNFASGFLPSHYQGTVFRQSGDPILYLGNPPGISHPTQRASLDLIRDLNRKHRDATGDAEIASRISNYELAFRMQTAAPELTDLSSEPAETRELYGLDRPDEAERQFAGNCVLARRMVERGVRFVLMMDHGWDDHTEINKKLPKRARKIDRPTAALLKDLKRRGLLEETLVVWGGEFGRTPMVELRTPEDASYAGRDHQPSAYSLWMAGGGIRGGQVVGRTDDFGIRIEEDPIHVHDLQATLLHCLGLDHTRLTYRYMGREFRLTDVAGRVIEKLLV